MTSPDGETPARKHLISDNDNHDQAYGLPLPIDYLPAARTLPRILRWRHTLPEPVVSNGLAATPRCCIIQEGRRGLRLVATGGRE